MLYKKYYTYIRNSKFYTNEPSDLVQWAAVFLKPRNCARGLLFLKFYFMSIRVSTGIQSPGVRCTRYPVCHRETSGIPWDQQLPRLSDLWQCRCLHTSWHLGSASDKHMNKHEKRQMLLVNGTLYQSVQESWNNLKAHIVSCLLWKVT